MFPMLRESKDDRIRKSLIKFLTDIKESSKSGRTTWAVRKEDAEMCKSSLAYLEKLAKSERVIKAARRVLNNWLDGTDCPDVSGDFTELEYAIREYDGDERQKEQKQAQTSEEKEYIRTIKSIISDFIRDKKPENLAYYQRIYDWLDGRHVPFSCSHENGQPAKSLLALVKEELLKDDVLGRKHLEGYIKGRNDALREMSDFMESHFNPKEEEKWMDGQ